MVKKIILALILSTSVCTAQTVDSKTVDSTFVTLNGLEAGVTASDIILTQRCLASQHCVEVNKLIGPTLTRQVTIDAAIFGASLFVSYELKKDGFKKWWVLPLIGITAHVIGTATGIMNR